jgi:hypothetical protein
VNSRGTPENLVPAHPGNHNATRSGIHSPRIIQERSAQIEAEFAGTLEWTPADRIALHEIARLMAIIEAIDHEFDEHGFLDKKGKPSYLLECRLRYSRKLEQWLEKCPGALRRPSTPDLATVDRYGLIQALWRIALGHDPATARDRLHAMSELGHFGADAFVRSREDLLPHSTEVTEEILEAYARTKSYDRLRRLIVARSEDGKPDEARRAVGAEVVCNLGQPYPTFPRELRTKRTRRHGGNR